MKKARNTIVLSLGDQILRKVIKEKSVADIWSKLEDLYLKKALPNRIYLKQRFYGFKMDVNISIVENRDDFTKLVYDLETMDIKLEEEVQAIFFLNSFPKAYDQLRDTFKYGKTSLTLDKVTYYLL